MTNAGVLIDHDGRPTLRFERRLSAPPERVWRAVTDKSEMRSWFPSAVQGERKVGAPLSFPFDTNVAEAFGGEVTEWSPMSVFAFTWNGDQLRIELTPDGDTTTLVFTHQLVDRSAAARTGSGWHACLGNLAAHFGAEAPSPDSWKETYDDYLARMGPPLGSPDGGAMHWDRAHHVAPDEVDATFAEPETWGGAADPDVSCEAEIAEHGSTYRVTHRRAGHDPELAARWHALLVQLDMFLASKQLIPVDPGLFVDDYVSLLS